MSPPADAPARRDRVRPLALLLAAALLVGSAIASWIWSLYAGSLVVPRRHARGAVARLLVRIERDGRHPHLRADNRTDLAFATGFVHGQDRFFQMDLLRRHPAGELAELLGGSLVAEDVHAPASLPRPAPAPRSPACPSSIAGCSAPTRPASSRGGGRSARRRGSITCCASSRSRGARKTPAWSSSPCTPCSRAATSSATMPRGLSRSCCPRPGAALPVAGRLAVGRAAGRPVLAATPIPDPDAIDLREDAVRWQAPPVPKQIQVMLAGSNNWAVDARDAAHGGRPSSPATCTWS